MQRCGLDASAASRAIPEGESFRRLLAAQRYGRIGRHAREQKSGGYSLARAVAPPPGAGGVEEVVARLLAVQAPDARVFRLAVRARSHGTSARDVDTALSERRTLVVSWLFRGTLQLVRSADCWWLHTLTAPRMVAGNTRRLAQLGLDEATTRRRVDTVHEGVAEGPKTRAELRLALYAADVPTAGQALVHVLVAATLRAQLVRGPVRNGEQCFVDAEQWLAPPPVLDRDGCLEMLARRYLAGHGPATPADLAAYAGITLTDARRGFDMITAETRPVDDTTCACRRR
jgi:Winged helix DNA-binding domain